VKCEPEGVPKPHKNTTSAHINSSHFMGTWEHIKVGGCLGFFSWWRSLTEKQKESCVCRISKDFCFLFQILGEIVG